jgi:hypothetical protein
MDLLHYFSKTRSSEGVFPIFLGSSIKRKYHQIEPLIRRGWLEVHPPVWSYIFYRDKIEDFIFYRCEVICQNLEEKSKLIELTLANKYDYIQGKGSVNAGALDPSSMDAIQERARKIEELIEESKRYKPVVSRYRTQIVNLRRYKEIFKHLLSVVRDIKINDRTPDVDQVARKKLIQILGSYDFEKGELLPKVNKTQGQRYLNELKSFGYWREFRPAQRYALTEVGAELELNLTSQKAQEKCQEEEEFDELMEKIRF